MLLRMYSLYTIIRNAHISDDSACDTAWKQMYESHKI